MRSGFSPPKHAPSWACVTWFTFHSKPISSFPIPAMEQRPATRPFNPDFPANGGGRAGRLPENPALGQNTRRACKPDSVQAGRPTLDGHSSRPAVADASPAANPDRWAKAACGGFGCPTRPARDPYLALLPVGLAVPVRLPVPRWALTPPFHPYPNGLPKRPVLGGLFSVALSLGLPPPGVTRHRCLVESGLSSHRVIPASGHPALRVRAT